MWGDLVGGSTGKRVRITHSFADRGDAWPSAMVAGASRQRNGADALCEGLIADTLVATETGWRPVQELQPGDRIVTFDNGMRPLKAAHVATLHTAAERAPRQVWPMQVPAGALGNRTAMQLMPGQSVLIESDAAEMLYGDPFSMVPASVLDGHNGITRTAPQVETVVVTLEFDEDEVVYANGMLLVHCAVSQPAAARPGDSAVLPYQRLTEAQARSLMKAMHQPF